MKNLWKQAIVILLLVCLAAVTAFSAGKRITLDSNKEMHSQIGDFVAWYDSIGFLEQAQWDLAFSNLTIGNYNVTETETGLSLTSKVTGEVRAVYVLPKRDVYHTRTLCHYISGKDNIITMDKDEAVDRNFRLCKTCAKK